MLFSNRMLCSVKEEDTVDVEEETKLASLGEAAAHGHFQGEYFTLDELDSSDNPQNAYDSELQISSSDNNIMAKACS